MKMPLPMVHLAVAVGLGGDQSPAFLLGSIAPDAIHMRPQTDRESKAVTHLMSPADSADHVRLRQMLSEHSALPAFAAGYAAHLLTDRLWEETMVIQFRDAVPPELNEADRRTLYYHETDQVDFNLYHHMAWRPEVWERLKRSTAPDFPPLLSADEIAAWRDRTLSWFEDPHHEPHSLPYYISDEMVQQFITETIRQISQYFHDWSIAIPDVETK